MMHISKARPLHREAFTLKSPYQKRIGFAGAAHPAGQGLHPGPDSNIAPVAHADRKPGQNMATQTGTQVGVPPV